MYVSSHKDTVLPYLIEFQKQSNQLVAQVFFNSMTPISYPVDPSYATIGTIPQELQSSPKKMVKWLTKHQYVPILKDERVFFEIDKPNHVFFHDGESYVIKLTRGEGSCALHALLGKEIEGVYCFPGYDCDVEAKNHFANTLQEALNGNDRDVEVLFVKVIMAYWADSSRNNATFEARSLFSTTVEGCNFSKQLQELQANYKQKIADIQKQQGRVWWQLAQKNPMLQEQLLKSDHYEEMEKEEVWEILSNNPLKLMNIINTQKSVFQNLLSKEDLVLIEQFEEELSTLQMEWEGSESSFMLSKTMIVHYIQTIKQPAFYLNTDEIKLAAKLFKKNVLIFGSDPIELVETINTEGADELIVIYHQGLHFSRCIYGSTESEPNNSEEKDSNKNFWYEDALPHDTIYLEKCKFKPHSDSIELEISKKDEQRIHLRSCEFLADNPALLVQLAETASIPKAHAMRFQMQALAKIIESANEESQKALNKKDFDKSAQILEKIALLTKDKLNLQTDLKQIRTSWDHEVRKYFKKSFELLILIQSQEQIDEFFAQFDALRELNPNSHIPYHPILTFLASRLEKATLKRFLKEARDRDCYLTYALVVGFARATLTHKDSIMFQGYKPDGVLKVLQQVYPQDLVLPILLEALKSESQDALMRFSSVAAYLQKALEALATGEISFSIEQIVRATPLLCGYSNLHRYLAVAWSCYGDFVNAEKIVKRASQLPDLHLQNLPQFLLEILATIVKSEASDKIAMPDKSVDPSHNFLAALVEMFQTQPLNLDLATDFVKEAASILESDLEQLPLVYFGIQNLASRLAVGTHKFFETCIPLFNALIDCMSRLLHICHQVGDLDPWIADIATIKVKGDRFSFIIKGPEIRFRISPIQKKEIPFFNFSDNLKLTSQSVRSIATCTTKEVHGLWLGLAVSHLMVTINHENLPLPEDPLIFTGLIQSGLIEGVKGSNEPFFRSAVLLKKYLTIQQTDRPYRIDQESLEWAKFCVFSLNLAIELPENSYYPENFSIPDALDELKINNSLIAPVNKELKRNALRDVYLADYNLRARSSTQTVNLCEAKNLYSLYKIARTQFGWLYGESFEEWGIRLENMEISGLAASDFNQMEGMSDVHLQPNTIEIEDHLSAKARKALRVLLQFWLEFQKKTEEKNEFIRKGGDEDSGAAAKDWSKPQTWLLIIANNTPQIYPDYQKFSKREQEALTQIVNNKHVHHKEVQELKKLCIKPGHLSSDSFVVNMAIVLLINAESDRNTAHHSVFMENEAQARRLYQLLLEISIERTVNNALISAGMQGWIDFNRVNDILLAALNPLIGAFHGPEKHVSGNGPTQMHYNAGIVTSKLRSQNVHIYFSEY